mmetsp:Transcript_11435/g.40638  ORF Transcript_11435/g.40638 Transcript_11435/m.40638 type:complete len:254 (-) Transcript_11435:313-1074(-)
MAKHLGGSAARRRRGPGCSAGRRGDGSRGALLRGDGSSGVRGVAAVADVPGRWRPLLGAADPALALAAHRPSRGAAEPPLAALAVVARLRRGTHADHRIAPPRTEHREDRRHSMAFRTSRRLRRNLLHVPCRGGLRHPRALDPETAGIACTLRCHPGESGCGPSAREWGSGAAEGTSQEVGQSRHGPRHGLARLARRGLALLPAHVEDSRWTSLRGNMVSRPLPQWHASRRAERPDAGAGSGREHRAGRRGRE